MCRQYISTQLLMTAADLITVLTAVIYSAALLNPLTHILLWQQPLADVPGYNGEPSTLHQLSAHWHGINAEVQM